MHPKDISILDYSYDLPDDKIAKFPLAKRDASKLLIYRDGEIKEDVYANIDAHIPGGALLLFNNTKVIEARLLFQKETGGVIEIFCLEPHDQYADITTAMMQQGSVLWKCLVGGASKWKHGQVLTKKFQHGNTIGQLDATYIEKKEGHFIISLSWQPAELSFAEVIHHAGAIPLPPYMKRDAEPGDEERYQTVYARHDGSVAAPTAGLHFTPAIFKKLEAKNIRTGFLTLHVGAGTFKPVKSATMETHDMHAEFIDVSIHTIQHILEQLVNPVIAVGTTSLRTLESLYWMGVKCIEGQDPRKGLTQWEAYDALPQDISARDALQALLNWMKQYSADHIITKTSIIIAPGYKMRLANALLTNFHQPHSTLLLLVAALIGDDWKKVYHHALSHEYRFLSYGDGSLLWTK